MLDRLCRTAWRSAQRALPATWRRALLSLFGGKATQWRNRCRHGQRHPAPTPRRVHSSFPVSPRRWPAGNDARKRADGDHNKTLRGARLGPGSLANVGTGVAAAYTDLCNPSARKSADRLRGRRSKERPDRQTGPFRSKESVALASDHRVGGCGTSTTRPRTPVDKSIGAAGPIGRPSRGGDALKSRGLGAGRPLEG
jgi:hypothetical protein